jgi:hypothetical protein
MDYTKINDIKTDGSGNIILQDITGATVNINYNDPESLKMLFEKITEAQTFEIKQILGNQNKEILTEIRKIQQKLDEQNTNKKSEEVTKNLDDFFKELYAIKIDGFKSRLMTNYSMLREYEDFLILEKDPMQKRKYEKDIEMVKTNILKDETELKNIKL